MSISSVLRLHTHVALRFGLVRSGSLSPKSLYAGAPQPRPGEACSIRPRASLQKIAMTALFAATVSARASQFPIPDLTYGDSGDGIARIAVAGVPADNAYGLHATVQSDGRLVLIGAAQTSGSGTSSSQLVLARFDTQGLPDTSFGAEHDGLYRTALSDSGSILTGLFADVAQSGNGRLVYTGHVSPATMIVGRLTADGTPDPSFGSNGRRLIGPSALVDGALDASFTTVLPLANGTTLALGVALVPTTPDSYNAFSCAMRLATDGSTDTSFGTVGRTCLAPALTSGATSFTTSGQVLADGRILLAGVSVHSGGSAADMSVARLLADGTLDTAFGPNHDGWAFVAFDQGGTLNDGALSMAVDAAGRILLAGSCDVAEGTDVAVARLLADGRPDLSFGTQGRVQIRLTSASSHYDKANSIVAFSNGGILVGALANDQAGVSIALRADGELDPGFGESGIYYAPQATLPVRSRQQIVAGDYIYRAGDSNNLGGHSDFAATRAVIPLFADSFENPDVSRPAAR